MSLDFRTIDVGTIANPCQTSVQCTKCTFQHTVVADNFGTLQERILVAIYDHVWNAHPNQAADEPADESGDEIRRHLAESRAAYAELERMYHRVTREHLVTALRLHKARAKLRKRQVTGGTVNITGVTIAHLPPGGPEMPPGFHALLNRARKKMIQRGF